MIRRASRRLPRWIAMLALMVILALAGWSQTTRSDRPQTASTPTTSSTAAVEAPRSGPSQTASASAQGLSQQVSADLAAISNLPTPTAPPGTPTIIGEAASQPDLYAAEFVRRLLTQDYASPRDALLAWVNAESAPTSEPLVVGLVPTNLRDRLAMFSVTDTSRSPAPIPTQQEWSALGSQSVTQEARIDAVREPLAWLNAVAGGQISDPGCTAREVAGTVTRHTPSGDERSSVVVTLQLEGPPSRATWGFVASVIYRSIPLGPS